MSTWHSTVVEYLEEWRWGLQRHREFRSLRTPVRPRVPSPGRPHLMVVPHYGPGHPSWGPGTRNFYFEAAQVARERYPELEVSVLELADCSGELEWHERVLDAVRDRGVTHILGHTEVDPENESGTWTWDHLWRRLSAASDVVLIGVLFDSAFRWITAGSRQLARISDRYVLADICMPMDGVLRRRRPEVGPVNMPMSELSFALIDKHLEGLAKEFDVSFIGALYPYRVEMIQALRDAGLRVAVNPHRLDETTDFESSRTGQPSFLDYMAGLARSEMTINFSRSSAGPFEQLKTRVIEAASVGTLVLTDDGERTRLFWEPGEEFDTFVTPADLPAVVARWLENPDRLRSAQAKARTRARVLARDSFWGGIDVGLARRGLRPLADDS